MRSRIWYDFTLTFLPRWTVTWSWGLFYHSNGNESRAPCKKDQGKSWLDPWTVWFNSFCFGLYSALFVLVFVDSLLSLSYPFLLLHSFSFHLEAIGSRGWRWLGWRSACLASRKEVLTSFPSTPGARSGGAHLSSWWIRTSSQAHSGLLSKFRDSLGYEWPC